MIRQIHGDAAGSLAEQACQEMAKFMAENDRERICRLETSLAYAEQQLDDLKRPSARQTLEANQEAVAR